MASEADIINFEMTRLIRAMDEPHFMAFWRTATDHGATSIERECIREAERRSRKQMEACEARARDELDDYWGRGKYTEQGVSEEYFEFTPEPPRTA